ncbi:MAG: Phosphate transport system permease protein PstA [Alphaproteobacteria bacterium MarineAlpha6_Bin2]|nr:MAG: Phosphate transport system permease protein PstA [Alphaproteobacteria bacterium MarineAlpha6_Bin2]
MSSTINQDIASSISSARINKEKRFQIYGVAALLFAMIMLVTLFITIFSKGLSAFIQTKVNLDIELTQEVIDPEGSRDLNVLKQANYQKLIDDSLKLYALNLFDKDEKELIKNLRMILSPIAYLELRNLVIDNQDFIGKTKKVSFIASDDIDQYFKGKIDMSIPEDDRKITDIQEKFLDDLQSKGQINKVFNKTLFTKSDSREAELSGVLGAVIGSFYSLLIAGLLSIPIGIGAAIYLQEFAKKNRITDFIEININNLAAVPSIVFGLLGLAIFLNMFLMPRSAPLVGGMVLALMTLPKIIIPARAAILAVPESIKQGALALGASHMQSIMHHVLPLAMPAILTGIIIGLAQALGETAPLLMIGMIAFIPDTPLYITDPATALPVQIFMWADNPERAFVERTSAAIIILLFFLIAMNSIAIYLRQKFERKW